MKYLFILALCAGGYYFYSGNLPTETETTSYQEVFKKMHSSGATTHEIERAAYLLAVSLCNDSYFQEAGDSSTPACLSRLESRSASCNVEVFSGAPDIFYDKDTVAPYLKKFHYCTGIVQTNLTKTGS